MGLLIANRRVIVQIVQINVGFNLKCKGYLVLLCHLQFNLITPNISHLESICF